MNRTWTAAGALGFGAGLMYFFDPDRGTRRRAMLRDRLVHMAHVATRGMRVVSSDLFHRTQGAMAELDARFREGAVSDNVLVARVRSVIGRRARHPHAVQVNAEDGKITLSGPVLSGEARRIANAARSVRGVRGITNRLEVHGFEDAPPLQGDPVRQWRLEPAPRIPELWSRGARLVAGASGAALALYGARRATRFKLGSIAVGAALVARSLANRDLRLIGDAYASGIDTRCSIDVEVPVGRAFALWKEPEILQRVFAFAHEIEPTWRGRLHWRVRGAGTGLEWETIFTRQVPNESIAWRTVAGSVVEHFGSVHFEALSAERTRLMVRLCFRTPSVGPRRSLLGIFTRSPRVELAEDLERFRAIAVTTGTGLRADEPGSRNGPRF
jgi:uncharacterized membrane protein